MYTVCIYFWSFLICRLPICMCTVIVIQFLELQLLTQKTIFVSLLHKAQVLQFKQIIYDFREPVLLYKQEIKET